MRPALRLRFVHVSAQGILPNLAKVAPAAGISWFVFEEVKLLFGVDPHS